MARTVAVPWFPPGQLELALSLWPELAEGWEDRSHAAYCRFVDRRLRDLAGDDTTVLIALVDVKPYVKWCAREGLDPSRAEARQRYAVDVATRGRVRPWPGPPDKPCWCGRGDSRATCCGV